MTILSVLDIVKLNDENSDMSGFAGQIIKMTKIETTVPTPDMSGIVTSESIELHVLFAGITKIVKYTGTSAQLSEMFTIPAKPATRTSRK